MINPSFLSPDSWRNSTSRRLVLCGATSFLLLVCFSHLHQGSLQIDSVRYAHIAHLFVDGDSWFNLYDEFKDSAYGNKPPLLFWLVGLSTSVFGFSTFAVKFPAVCFLFIGLLIFWDLVARWLGARVAFFSLFLLCLSRVFFRALADLNFEGMVLCAAVCWLRLLVLMIKGEQLRALDWSLALIGTFLFLQSKPPYLLFILLPFLYAIRQGSHRRRIVIKPWVYFGFAVSLIVGLSWLFFIERQASGVVLDNQLVRPFALSMSYWGNLLAWLQVCVLDYAPLSWLAGWLIAARLGSVGAGSQADITSEERRLLGFWMLPIFPIVLLIDCQSRYLLMPVLAVAVLTGEFLGRRFRRIPVRFFCWGSITACVLAFVLFVGFSVPIHKPNSLLALMRKNNLLTSDKVLICLDGQDVPNSRPSRKRLQMLLELELGQKFQVMSSVMLPREQAIVLPLVANDACLKHLKSQGIELLTRDSSWRAEIVEVLSQIPNELTLTEEEHVDER